MGGIRQCRVERDVIDARQTVPAIATREPAGMRRSMAKIEEEYGLESLGPVRSE